jgi:hypothetical protein
LIEFLSIQLKIVILGTHRKTNSKSSLKLKVASSEEAIEQIGSNATIMIGGRVFGSQFKLE